MCVCVCEAGMGPAWIFLAGEEFAMGLSSQNGMEEITISAKLGREGKASQPVMSFKDKACGDMIKAFPVCVY